MSQRISPSKMSDGIPPARQTLGLSSEERGLVGMVNPELPQRSDSGPMSNPVANPQEMQNIAYAQQRVGKDYETARSQRNVNERNKVVKGDAEQSTLEQRAYQLKAQEVANIIDTKGSGQHLLALNKVQNHPTMGPQFYKHIADTNNMFGRQSGLA